MSHRELADRVSCHILRLPAPGRHWRNSATSRARGPAACRPCDRAAGCGRRRTDPRGSLRGPLGCTSRAARTSASRSRNSGWVSASSLPMPGRWLPCPVKITASAPSPGAAWAMSRGPVPLRGAHQLRRGLGGAVCHYSGRTAEVGTVAPAVATTSAQRTSRWLSSHAAQRPAGRGRGLAPGRDQQGQRPRASLGSVAERVRPRAGFLQNDVGVGPADAEGRDACAPHARAARPPLPFDQRDSPLSLHNGRVRLLAVQGPGRNSCCRASTIFMTPTTPAAACA